MHLLNDAREKTDAIIDRVHRFRTRPTKKPRTYRQTARKEYLRVAMTKKPGDKKRRRGIGKQLRDLRRNVATISRMAHEDLLVHVNPLHSRQLLVISALSRQQAWMYAHRSPRLADRIVSISQPHVHPIVRGNAGRNVECGANVSVSLLDGISFVDRISGDAYNESGDVIAQVEAYHRRFGWYPASVHADTIYRTRANRRYCSDKGIRFSGPPLGRPKKMTEHTAEQVKQEKPLRRSDETDRIASEGTRGQGNRRVGLARIMTTLAVTSEVMIRISLLVMNLEPLLSRAGSFGLYTWGRGWNILLRTTWVAREPPAHASFRYRAC